MCIFPFADAYHGFAPKVRRLLSSCIRQCVVSCPLRDIEALVVDLRSVIFSGAGSTEKSYFLGSISNQPPVLRCHVKGSWQHIGGHTSSSNALFSEQNPWNGQQSEMCTFIIEREEIETWAFGTLQWCPIDTSSAYKIEDLITLEFFVTSLQLRDLRLSYENKSTTDPGFIPWRYHDILAALTDKF